MRAGAELARRRRQFRQQQVRQQERRQMVDGEGHLDAVGGDRALTAHHAGIVDQHVEPRAAVGNRGGEPPHLVLPGEIGGEELHRSSRRGGADDGRGGIAPVLAPAGDHDVRPAFGQPARRDQADAATAAGDQHRLAVHSVVRLRHGQPPPLRPV